MLNRGFVVLCISAFVIAIGAGIIVPILPLYTDSLGATGIMLGIVFSSTPLTMALCSPFMGRLSDRLGKKLLITSGLAVGSFIAITFVWATNSADLITIRLLQGISNAMVVPIVMAYMGELSPKGQEGSYMGVYSMMAFLGMAAGPLAGGVIADSWGMDSSFYAFGGSLGIVFILTLFLLPPQKGLKEPQPISKRPLKDILASDPLKGLFVFSFTLAIAQSGLMVFLPLLAKGQQLTITEIGLLASVFVLSAGILQVPFGIVADRYNKVMLVMIGTLSVAVGLAYMTLVPGFLSLLCLAAIMGVASAVASPAANAMVVEYSREIGMGVVMGSMRSFTSLGMIIGPIVAGIAMDLVNIDYAFYLCSMIFIIGACVFYHYTKDISENSKD